MKNEKLHVLKDECSTVDMKGTHKLGDVTYTLKYITTAVRIDADLSAELKEYEDLDFILDMMADQLLSAAIGKIKKMKETKEINAAEADYKLNNVKVMRALVQLERESTPKYKGCLKLKVDHVLWMPCKK